VEATTKEGNGDGGGRQAEHNNIEIMGRIHSFAPPVFHGLDARRAEHINDDQVAHDSAGPWKL
jgi:hypothetical protein